MFGAEAVVLGEQPRELVGGDARTGVGDRDTDAAILADMTGNADAAAVAVVLDRVGGQVQQHLLEPLAVGLDGPGALRRGGRVDVRRTLRGQWPNEVDGVVQDLVDVHRLRRQRQVAALDAGEVQHLVDEA